jgi:hypothetical protein
MKVDEMVNEMKKVSKIKLMNKKMNKMEFLNE